MKKTNFEKHLQNKRLKMQSKTTMCRKVCQKGFKKGGPRAANEPLFLICLASGQPWGSQVPPKSPWNYPKPPCLTIFHRFLTHFLSMLDYFETSQRRHKRGGKPKKISIPSSVFSCFVKAEQAQYKIFNISTSNC